MYFNGPKLGFTCQCMYMYICGWIRAVELRDGEPARTGGAGRQAAGTRGGESGAVVLAVHESGGRAEQALEEQDGHL